MDDKNSIPEAVSINQLCALMSISRSRYYQILNEGLIHPPIFSDSKRPYFTREMALKNLAVKKNNVGVNGKICIFYNCKSSPISSPKNNSKKREPNKKTTTKHTDLIDGLSSLGLNDITSSQVDEAVKKCFPNEIDVDEGELLRLVFCQIKEQNSTDNVNG